MKYSDIEKRKSRRVLRDYSYTYQYYINWDYSILEKTLFRKKNGKKSKTFSEVYIMLDTETSKHHEPEYTRFGNMVNQENHVVAWTISTRAFHQNLCTLRGSKPTEICHCLNLIRDHIPADKIYIFVHNLAYDWIFLRRFLIDHFGKPIAQLNIKSHAPITIEFDNGIILRDSLILAGVSLDRWGKNLDVDHRKAIGSWDYDLIRNQNFIPDDDELHYIENDTLVGVECLNKLADQLGDTLVSLPLTLTGIVRRRIRQEGKKNFAKQKYKKQAVSFHEYLILEQVYHGGYTHANRGIVSYIWENVSCRDFKSSYPYCMITGLYPCEKFYHLEAQLSPSEIFKDSEKRSYIFKFVAVNIRLKDSRYPMPALQFAKCLDSINVIKDNGRILKADYVEIYLNEIDLEIINRMYIWDEAHCIEVMTALKDYLPRWYRDEVWKIFEEKCRLEYQIKVLGEGDISQYNIIKGQLNSLYGMCSQKKIKEEIKELYEDDPENDRVNGDYYLEASDLEELYEKGERSYNNILPYVWGVYVTSYAMQHLYDLSGCINEVNYGWLYSDTDSIYSNDWNDEKLAQYNENVKQELVRSGYGVVRIEDHEYWLGIAEPDGDYKEFITTGAKRYAVRQQDDSIKITVAGVPKKAGARCLESLEDFREGFIFPGVETGKKTLTYIYSDIHIDDNGNECADSIDMTPADYTLSSVEARRFEDLFTEQITLPFYEE